ncbi:hypothetical protein [Vibrio hepatarius]|uniref:hypothetical protein n=1 Tax=Vibrio hepatarius TaxID=171383 RepID=UPI001C09D8BD|nr:hypothetical protein [Vibrio hepatarius]MBU2895549.1 hypothetical protein [Vibrio hepatarius]
MSHPIDRRKFLKNVSAASVLAYGSMSSMKGLAAIPSGNEFKLSIDPDKLNVGIYLYPNVTMLDAYGPLQVLAVSDSCNVFTFAKHNKPVYSDAKTDLLPHYGFSDCPRVDIGLS